MSRVKILDLTNSHDSSPSPHISSSNVPMILNFGHVSANPDLHNPIHHYQHRTNAWVSPPQGSWVLPPSGFSNNTYHIANIPQLGMHGDNPIAWVLQPLPRSNTSSNSSGARLRVPWSQQEHDLFVKGLTEYGKGEWTKISKHYVCNKTPQQVQSHARSFFKHLPPADVHRFRKKKPTSNSKNFVSTRNKETLNLFPKKAYRGESSTSMVVPSVSVGNGEVDVELRLSLYK